MGIKFSVDKDKAAEIRKILDPLVDHPPTVGTNEKFPNLTCLDYEVVKNESAFMMTAMSNGARSLSRY